VKNKNLVAVLWRFLRPDQVRFGLFCCSHWPISTSMSVQPKGQSPSQSSPLFEIKSATLPLVALMLKSENWDAVATDLGLQYGAEGESPEFFDNDPVVLDFSAQARDAVFSDLTDLLKALHSCRLVALAFRGEPEHWTAPLLATGLVQAPVDFGKGSKGSAKPAPMVQTVVREVPGPATMVIDKPVRSGQKIYARGADLVILAMVNQGAEVVADGNIHVYAPLRGKAMAGARGNASARIFSLCLEPELISIAGVYRTSENPLPLDVAGKPAQVRLASEDGQDKLLIEPLKN
jgi:septum site-determining protein MinC